MRWLELRLVLLSLDGSFALQRLLRVGDVDWEFAQGLVVASLGRIRWLEGLIVDHGWSRWLLLKSVGNGWVLLQDLS